MLTLSDATTRAFWLNGSAWEYPDFENADTFVTRLARQGIIAHDFAVGAMLDGEHAKWPIRSAQRHFVRSTGITHRTLRQIERARYATTLLKQGVSILDSVDAAGYFDQPHLNVVAENPDRRDTGPDLQPGAHQLSFLYKTKPLPGRSTMRMGGLSMIASNSMTVPIEGIAHGRSRVAGIVWNDRSGAFPGFRHHPQGAESRPRCRRHDFARYPAGSVVWIGVIELVCLALYLVPRTAVLGALLMTGYLGGAIATHVRISSPLFTHTLFPVYVALLMWERCIPGAAADALAPLRSWK